MTTTHTIGSGETYTLVREWLNGTSGTLTDDYVGEVKEALATDTSGYNRWQATSTATYFRTLKAEAGDEYDIINNTGASSTLDFGAFDRGARIDATEDYPVMQNVKIKLDSTTGYYGIQNQGADYVTLFSIYIDMTPVTDSRQGIQMGTSGDNHIMRNVIIQGTGSTNAGIVSGIDCQGQITEVSNCLAYGIGDNSAGIGIRATDADSVVKNCIMIDAYGTDFSFGGSTTHDHNMSSDSTATGTNSHTSATAADIWRDAANDDFRLMPCTDAVSGGEDLSGTGGFSEDFLLNTHGEDSQDWNMGPFERVPTLESTIGGTSPDFATVQLWADEANSKSLITGKGRYIGLIRSAKLTGDVSMSATAANTTYYRTLKYDTGARYDISTTSGAEISGTGVAAIVLDIMDDYAEVIGVRVTMAAASTRGIRLDGDDTVCDGVYVDGSSCTASAAIGILAINGSDQEIRNSMIVGNDSGTNGLRRGISSGVQCTVYNNNAKDVDDGDASCQGIRVTNAGSVVRNNCAIGNAADFEFGVSTTHTNNVSGDSTATGTDSHTGVSASDVWNDASSGDYRVVTSSDADGGGFNITSLFTEDYVGDTWGVPVNIGTHNETVGVAPAGIEVLRRRREGY